MKKTSSFSNYKSFNIPLNSKTNKKRINEAVKLLSGIYPFEIDASNIYIEHTNKKGFYNVYISDTTLNNKNTKLRIIVLLLVILSLGLIIGLVFHHISKTNKVSFAEQKEQERLELEELELKKKKEEKLVLLQKEYETLQAAKYERIYPYIERIFLIMTNNSTIENLMIEGTSFSVEVTTNNAIELLENFENNPSFNYVKMNRTTIKGNSETVIYTGIFSKVWKDIDENSSLDTKLNFYSTQIEDYKMRTERMNNIPLSEYISNIRNVLRKNSCKEEYIQLKGNEKSINVDFFIISTSQGILSFIEDIQENENNLIDIKQISIRNNENKNKIQTTICFDSGISLEKNNDNLLEYNDKKIPASEIDKLFIKKQKSKTIKKAQSNDNIAKPKTSSVIQSTQKLYELTYIGITKFDGKTLIIVKDPEMNVIYKIPLCDSEIEGDYCLKTNNGYKVIINGNIYEVKL